MGSHLEGGGWKVSTSKHRAPDTTRNLKHGNNTLIGQVSAFLGLGGVTRYHGMRCDGCVHFEGCTKTPTPDQDYCAFFPPRFNSGKAIQ